MENTFFKDYQSMVMAIDALKKDANNPFFKSKYVQLKDVLAEVKKVCVQHNFIFYQKPANHDGKNFLQTTIQHSSGENIEGEIEIVSKDNNDPQKIGGGITYMRRYSLTCMFGIEEEDDDGNISAKTKPATKVGVKNEDSFIDTEYPADNVKVCPSCAKKHTGQYPKCIDCWKKDKK